MDAGAPATAKDELAQKEKKPGRVKSFLIKHGIELLDIPKAILALKGVGYISFLGTLAVCYRFQPLQTLSKRPGPRKLMMSLEKRYPAQYAKTRTWVLEKSEKLANWKYFRPIPEKLGLQPKRFSLAIAENLLFYKVATPILLPLQFWFVIQMFRKNPSQTPTLEEFMEGVDVISNHWPQQNNS